MVSKTTYSSKGSEMLTAYISKLLSVKNFNIIQHGGCIVLVIDEGAIPLGEGVG